MAELARPTQQAVPLQFDFLSCSSLAVVSYTKCFASDNKVIPEKYILRINSHGYGTSKTLEHTSAAIFSEYRVIIINPVSPFHLMPSLESVSGIIMGEHDRRILSGHYSYSYDDVDLRHFETDFSARRNQLVKFLRNGGLLICFLQPFFVFNSDLEGIPQSISNYDWLSPLFNNFKLKEKHMGKEVVPTIRGLESPFAPYLKLQELKWNACVETFDERIKKAVNVLAINRENDVVSFTIKLYGKGEAVFLPISSNPDADKLLLECVDKEYTRIFFVEAPADTWVEKYYIPGTPQLEKEIEELRTKIGGLKQIETTKEREIKKLKSYRDALLNKKGLVLQNTVIEILNEMDVKAEPGPEGRDDIVIYEGEKVLVVCEVKGDKKSAGEGDATQLSKWVDRVYGEKGYEPKGILIVNAFNEKDVLERREKPFPDQMLPYCLKRGYCLLTTVQLFNIFCEFRRGSIDGKSILKEWIDCNGAYDKYHDIQPNLSKGSGD